MPARANRARGLSNRKPFSVDRFAGKLHYHGCSQCHVRYTCACGKPGEDDLCEPCMTGNGWSLHYGVTPRPCCFEECVEATNDQRETYKLVGPGPWWICHRCCRQFTAYPGSTA